jgi:hypothetical protein
MFCGPIRSGDCEEAVVPDGVKRDAYIDPQVLADLTADTEARLAHPGKFLITILRRYWAEATADEATTSWRRTVRSNPGYAIDVLNCFHQVISDPPADLVELIVGQSRVIFYNVTSEGWKPFDVADYVAWLSTVAVEWQEIFATAQRNFAEEERGAAE